MAIKPDKIMYHRKSTNGYEEVTATFECPNLIKPGISVVYCWDEYADEDEGIDPEYGFGEMTLEEMRSCVPNKYGCVSVEVEAENGGGSTVQIPFSVIVDAIDYLERV